MLPPPSNASSSGTLISTTRQINPGKDYNLARQEKREHTSGCELPQARRALVRRRHGSLVEAGARNRHQNLSYPVVNPVPSYTPTGNAPVATRSSHPNPSPSPTERCFDFLITSRFSSFPSLPALNSHFYPNSAARFAYCS